MYHIKFSEKYHIVVVVADDDEVKRWKIRFEMRSSSDSESSSDQTRYLDFTFDNDYMYEVHTFCHYMYISLLLLIHMHQASQIRKEYVKVFQYITHTDLAVLAINLC